MYFSVLMAHYNNARFLENALDSIFKQTFEDWEIVLVDDGSTDDFEKIAAKHENNPRVRIFRNGKNQGCSFTKHKCINLAEGKVLAFMDPDDAILPDALQTLAEAHMQNPEHSIVHSTHFICDQQLRVLKIADYPKQLPENTPYLLLNDGSIHHFASFKKELYDKTRGLTASRDYDKAIDQELYYLMEEQGPVLFINKPLYYYRIHEGGISNFEHVGLSTIQHFNIVERICGERIKQIKKRPDEVFADLAKRYKTRYYKIRILNSYRKKKWFAFTASIMAFPFYGGMRNIWSYLKKLPGEGRSLIRRSFSDKVNIAQHP